MYKLGLIVICIIGLSNVSFSQTLNLTTNGQYVVIGDVDVSGTQITVEALVKKTSGVNVLSKHTAPADVNYLLRVGTFELTTSTQFYLMNNPYAGSMVASNWYHIAGTYDGSFIRYYVNGCLIVEAPASGTITTNNLISCIGNRSTTPTEQFFGEIDELRIWSEARTAAQLTANMFDLPNPATYANLRAYYKFNGNLNNEQGNATFNGTWFGTPSYGTQPLSTVIPTFAVQSITPTAASCFGTADGKIDVVATGTNLRYSLDALTWQTSNQFTGLVAGTYSVSVRTPEGCIITDATIIVTEPAIVNATASNNGPYCTGEATALIGSSTSAGTLNYQWTGPGGYSSTAQNPTNATLSGTYTLIVTNSTSCSSLPQTTNLIVAPSSPLTITKTDPLCNGGTSGSATVATIAPGTHTYLWTPSGGTAATATGLAPGNYSVEVTNQAGCVSTSSVTILNPSPLGITLTSTTVNCGNRDGSATATVVGGTGNINYVWAPGGQTTNSISGIAVGMYSVVATDVNGCSVNSSVFVDQTLPLNLTVNPTSAVIFEDESVSLNASFSPYIPGVVYSWTPTNGLSCTDCPNPIATPGDSTVYIVNITTTDGCVDQDSISIYTKVRCGEHLIPNSFSPNGDGVNDVFKVYGKCIVAIKIQVYDRWGEKVFNTETLDFGWDGTLNGQIMNTGSYIFQIDLSFNDGTYITETGNVNLVR